jgi:thioredoxin 1
MYTRRMRTRPLLTGMILIGIALSFYMYQYQRAQTSQPPNGIKKEPISVSSTDVTPTIHTSVPRYMIYTPTDFDAALGKKRVYFFYASWCPTCRPVDRDFQTYIDQIPSDVVVFRTDYDTERELKTQYSITYQHTFVLVDDSGNAVKIWNGGGLKELVFNTQ